MKFVLPNKRTFLLVTITAAATLLVSSLVFMWLDNVSNIEIPSVGTIRTRGVEGYWDENLTNRTEKWNWGTMWPGLSKNLTIYLRSISNYEATLNLTTGNWTFWSSSHAIVTGPDDSTLYMDLEWDCIDKVIHPGETLQATLTLSVERSLEFIEYVIDYDVKEFSFDTYISTSD